MIHFDIVMTITLEANMINRPMTAFFKPTVRAQFIGIFYFCISRASKFNFMEFPLCVMFCSAKYTFTW